MAVEQRDLDVLNTWTDQLNNALDALGILLSGDDAASIFPALNRGSALEKLRSVTEAEIAQIADAANQYCETEKIGVSHIRNAVERAKWHWRDA
jgi:hypothetical protein